MGRRRTLKAAIVAMVVAGLATAAVALADDGEAKCETAKLSQAAKATVCYLKAHAKAVKKGREPKTAACDARLSAGWDKAEKKADGACLSVGRSSSARAIIEDHSGKLLATIAGEPVSVCGDGVAGSGEQCDTADLRGEDCFTLGFTMGGELGCTATCAYDSTGCASQSFSATGQTTSYVPDDDAALSVGVPLLFVDNGDGTVSDLNSGLMWEKKSDDGGLHDANVGYVWLPGPGSIWSWLDAVNSEDGVGFAGYADWRIPNLRELQSLVDYERVAPSVDDVFNDGCLAGCTVISCSCTQSSSYWASTTYRVSPTFAWQVNHFDGSVGILTKDARRFVRAVR